MKTEKKKENGKKTVETPLITMNTKVFSSHKKKTEQKT